MLKLTGLFDLDGVVVDLCGPWLEKYNQEYEDNLTLDEMFGTWHVEHAVKPEAQDHVYNMFDSAEDYAALPPIPGAVEGMRQLHDTGKFDIYILSAFMGKGGVADGKCRWISEHLPFLDEDRIILTHSKDLVFGDFFVDDSVQNLLQWSQMWSGFLPSASPIMMEAPHNKNLDLNTGRYREIDIRVSGWIELLEYLLKIVV